MPTLFAITQATGTMQTWVIVTAVSFAFTIPVLCSAYYSFLLLISALRYPRNLGNAPLDDFPHVSILLATYDERYVIGATLDAVKNLDYPRNKLQVIVADDSDDETSQIIAGKVQELASLGIATLVSRRNHRQGYKSGALNHASPLLKGEYVLLLDADSIVTPDVLLRGVAVLKNHAGASFVSYRVGHYNRGQNLITRLFSLSLDLGDTLNKMGSYAINAPFSLQGGYTLVSRQVLSDVGHWSEDTIVDDADLSCKIYAAGGRGIYLSDTRILGEDPSTLEVWKKQAARVSQGWAKCVSKHWRLILGTEKLSISRRIALFIALAGPFSSLSWIIVTFLSALSLVLGLGAPADSIFTNPGYVMLVSVPVLSFFFAAGYSLHVQKLMTFRSLLLLPLLSYTGYSMLTASSIGFLNGIIGRTGFFFRTPKSGLNENLTKTKYHAELRLGSIAVAELSLSAVSLVLSTLVLLRGVWFLGIALLGFGLLTLKSMNLYRHLISRVSKQPTR